MTSLYEELLQTKPKEGLKARLHGNKRDLEKRRQKKESILKEAEDRMLTVEEVKALRRKEADRRKYQKKDHKLALRGASWADELGFVVPRSFVYLGIEEWRLVAEAYREMNEWYNDIPKITMSEQEEKDYNYLMEKKADWLSLGEVGYFGVSRTDGRVYSSDSRDKWILGRPIRLIPTDSLAKIYKYYLGAQSYAREFLSKKAEESHQTVEGLVKANFRYDELEYKMKPYRRMIKPIRVPKKGSWLESITEGVHVQKKFVVYDYIRMIYEDRFMLGEVILPYTTYLCGDYVYFPVSRCAVASMYGNGEFFNETNRPLIHQWGRYMNMIATKYSICNRIPVFKGRNMRLIKVPSVKIGEEDSTLHNNTIYDYRVVPETENLGKGFSPDKTLEDVITRFKCPTYEECEYTLTRTIKPTNDIIVRPKKDKRSLFYFDTSED